MADNDQQIVTEARERHQTALQYESAWRSRAVEAEKFRFGEQWPDTVRNEREELDLPCLTINRTDTFVRRIANDIKAASIQAAVKALGDGAKVETAQVLGGMIRAIEAENQSITAKRWAIDRATTGGIGFWEIDTDWVSPDSFDQLIKVKRVFNPLSITFDPAAEQVSGEDAEWALKVWRMRKSTFDKRYPKAKGAQDWQSIGIHGDALEYWFDDDYVRLAHYWCVKEKPATLYQFENGAVAYQPEAFPGLWPVRERPTKVRTLYRYLMSGADVLSEVEWPGQFIPLVRVMGRESVLEGKREVKGAVTDLIDPGRAYNYARSAEIEKISLEIKSPWTGPTGAFKSPKWRDANKKAYAFIEWDTEAVMAAGGQAPVRQPGPQISPGLIQAGLNAGEDLKAVAGIWDASLGKQSNEFSGVAVQSRQSQSEVTNADFMEQYQAAEEHHGRILVDLIPHIYTGPRIVDILEPDGQERPVEVNNLTIDQGKQAIYDLGMGRYQAAVTTGPSYATQRVQTQEMLKELIQTMPQQLLPLLGDLLARNLDIKNSELVAKRLQSLLPPEVLAGENPQFANALQEKDQQIGMLSQQLEALQQALMDHQRELDIKAAEVQRKADADQLDYAEKMTGHEIEFQSDINEAGEAYK